MKKWPRSPAGGEAQTPGTELQLAVSGLQSDPMPQTVVRLLLPLCHHGNSALTPALLSTDPHHFMSAKTSL